MDEAKRFMMRDALAEVAIAFAEADAAYQHGHGSGTILFARLRNARAEFARVKTLPPDPLVELRERENTTMRAYVEADEALEAARLDLPTPSNPSAFVDLLHARSSARSLWKDAKYELDTYLATVKP